MWGSGMVRALALSVMVLCFVNISFAQDESSSGFGRYSRPAVVDARYGSGALQKQIENARALPTTMSKVILGQDHAIRALSDRLSQYLETFPTARREPIALNLVGLPGIGKSAMIEEIKKTGVSVVQLDLQTFSKQPDTLVSVIETRIRPILNEGKPLVLAIEEIDKLPEVGRSVETSSIQLIGAINQALSEGRMLGSWGVESNLSQVMIITTMNFSPDEIETFSSEVLHAQKSYYDFKTEDFQAFDAWIRGQPSAKYKVLSKLFRSNTVSRLAPQTLIMKPFDAATYRQLVELYARRAADGAQSRLGLKKKQMRVDLDTTLMDFLAQETVFAPSGARETIARVNSLVEQLVTFAVKVDGGDRESLARPREVQISFDPSSKSAVLAVTPYTFARGNSRRGETFVSKSLFNEETRIFEVPADFVSVKPDVARGTGLVAATPKVTKKQVSEHRYPEQKKAVPAAATIATAVNRQLVGQQNAASLVQDDFERYMARNGSAAKEPSSRALIGFPGIGKSDLFLIVAEALKIPLVKVNMQQYSSDSPETVIQFMNTISREVSKVRSQAPGGKYILLIEELDKVFEVNPQDGRVVNRPIMGIIKDLMGDGRAKVTTLQNGELSLDVRDAFLGFTMNFSIDRFQFKADPRLTSIEDVMRAWKRLKSTPADLKSVLGTMFLPETVSRIMSRVHVMKPLEEKDYKEVINRQVDRVVNARLRDMDGVNRYQVSLELAEAYKELLFQETVIPSEGARNTVVSAQSMIASDLEFALKRLKKYASYAKDPIVIQLQYDAQTQEVIAVVKSQKTGTETVVSRRGIALQFPPLGTAGLMSAERLRVAAHEFGHAYVAALLGYRFEYISVVSPQAGVGGYVKFRNTNGQSAYSLMANLYSTVASRALERIVLSDNPMAEDSVLDLTSGPSSDILQATKLLFSMLNRLGMNPDGGTMDRMGVEGPSRYANFSDLTPEQSEKIGQILRQMESYIVQDILRRHSKEWLAEKISLLSLRGGMNEAEFFQLVELTLPKGMGLVETSTSFVEMFKKSVVPLEKAPDGIVRNARNYSDFFYESVTGRRRSVPVRCEQVFSRL